ncbi:MAG: cyclic pyranopterin monophosphate synthase MoaC, partial [bacterium]|nr:cyclic pyranopterin monophosphate synthase MoaC [bacterium]
MSHSNFTHLDEKGSASMVDVGDKPISRRTALAAARCRMQLATAQAVREVSGPKGDVLQVARIAAISAAKRTDELIPLCHSVPLDRVDVQFAWPSEDLLEIRVQATATGRTGVEMEALLA